MLKVDAMKKSVSPRPLQALCSVGILLGLGGCGGIVGTPLGTVTPPVGYVDLTGNWQMTVTDAAGNPTFTSFAGFIDEQTGSGGTDGLTGVFQVVPGTCYLGAITVPATGTVTGANVNFRSFSVNGQYLDVTATKDATATQLTGTYTVSGGCANGDGGTVTGVRYAPLSGAYAGTIGSATQTASFSLTQAALGDGDGYSDLTGSVQFQGFSCFTSGTLTDASKVIGSAVTLTTTASDGETVTLQGTFDPAAAAISVTSGSVSGGACATTLKAGTLRKG